MPAKETLPPLAPKAAGIPSKPRYREQFGVILVCPDETAQRSLYDALEAVRSCKIRVVVT